MKRLFLIKFLFIFTFFIITSCNKKIELVPGEIFDEYRPNSYYQEYDLGQGDKVVRGYVNLANLEEKTYEEGLPTFELHFEFGVRYYDEDNNEVIEKISLPENFSIAANIETGEYLFKGLPEIDEEKEMLIHVQNCFWGVNGEVIDIHKNYFGSYWNTQTDINMPDATFYPTDESITATISFKYMVDDYWLENNEFENEAEIGSYEEMSYAELSAIATVSHQQYSSGLIFTKQAEDGLSYWVDYEMSMSDFSNQEVTFGGIAGGTYDEVGIGVYVNNNLYHGRKRGDFIINSGTHFSETVEIYIP